MLLPNASPKAQPTYENDGRLVARSNPKQRPNKLLCIAVPPAEGGKMASGHASCLGCIRMQAFNTAAALLRQAVLSRTDATRAHSPAGQGSRRDVEERRARLMRQRLGQQRLAVAWCNPGEGGAGWWFSAGQQPVPCSTHGMKHTCHRCQRHLLRQQPPLYLAGRRGAGRGRGRAAPGTDLPARWAR